MEYAPKQLAAVLLIVLASATVITAQNQAAQEMVDAHNAVRATVGVGPLAWDDTVAMYASTYAEKRRDCQLINSPEGRPYGENLYWESGTEWTAVDAVNFWAAEKQYYDHETDTCSAPEGQSCKHYTQVVWSGTTHIGCVGVPCDASAGIFIICSYSPPGNIEGQTPY